MRHSPEQYEALIARQKGWAAQGIKSGSGKAFGGAGVGLVPPKAKKPKEKPKRGEVGYVSPHAAAMAALASNPELRNGAQEHYEQVELFYWAELYSAELYESMAAVPNGGHRSKKTAADLRAEGVKPGYPDILVDLPAGAYHGARLEMKAENGRLSELQIETLNSLADKGFYCAVCWGVEEAKAVLIAYMALAPGQRMAERPQDAKWRTKK